MVNDLSDDDVIATSSPAVQNSDNFEKNAVKRGKKRGMAISQISSLKSGADSSSDCENVASKRLKINPRQSLEKALLKKKLNLEVSKHTDKGKGLKTADSEWLSSVASTSAQAQAFDVLPEELAVETNNQIVYQDNDAHCPVCFSKGILSQLTRCYIDLDSMISVCHNADCSYPIGLAVTTVKSAIGVI